MDNHNQPLTASSAQVKLGHSCGATPYVGVPVSAIGPSEFIAPPGLAIYDSI